MQNIYILWGGTIKTSTDFFLSLTVCISVFACVCVFVCVYVYVCVCPCVGVCVQNVQNQQKAWQFRQ